MISSGIGLGGRFPRPTLRASTCLHATREQRVRTSRVFLQVAAVSPKSAETGRRLADAPVRQRPQLRCRWRRGGSPDPREHRPREHHVIANAAAGPFAAACLVLAFAGREDPPADRHAGGARALGLPASPAVFGALGAVESWSPPPASRSGWSAVAVARRLRRARRRGLAPARASHREPPADASARPTRRCRPRTSSSTSRPPSPAVLGVAGGSPLAAVGDGPAERVAFVAGSDVARGWSRSARRAARAQRARTKEDPDDSTGRGRDRRAGAARQSSSPGCCAATARSCAACTRSAPVSIPMRAEAPAVLRPRGDLRATARGSAPRPISRARPARRRGEHPGDRRAAPHAARVPVERLPHVPRVLGRVRRPRDARPARPTCASSSSPRTRPRRAAHACATSRAPDLAVVMSSAAWEHYAVPGSPYFTLVDGAAARRRRRNRRVVAAGAEPAHPRRGRRARTARGPVCNGAAATEARIDRELLAHGIRPGDPRLYRNADELLPTATR